MPRVTKHVSQGRSEKPVRCQKCSDPIVKGEEYYQWAIKAQRGGTVYHQHTKHGTVRQSQLTHSKMSGAYAAMEDAQDSINDATCPEDVKSALETCMEGIEGVKDEYQESLDNMPENLQQGDTGQQIQEKIDGLESFNDELQTAIDSIEDEPDDLDDFEDEDRENRIDEHLQAMREVAEEALGAFSL